MYRAYDVILFDLDGTLTDSKIGITKSVQFALKKFGIIEDNLDVLDKFIGPPLRESFQLYYHFDDIKVLEVIEKYREYYSTEGIFENEAYPLIPELIRELFEKGKKLIVATSKPTVFAIEILKHFELIKYFSIISGSNLDGSRVRKSEVIQYALKQLDEKALDKVVMVGDRIHDVIGAKEVGIGSIGVLYGYGTLEEMQEAGSDFIVGSVIELKELLLNESQNEKKIF